MPFDGEEFGRNIVKAVNASIERSIEPLIKRLDALEAIGIPRNGKDADPVDMNAVRAMIVEECKDVRAGLESTIGPEMQEALAVMVREAMPAAPELPNIADMVDQAVSKAVEAIPAPKDGKDADPIDMDAVKAIIIEAMPVAPELPDIADMVDQAVSKAVEAIPAPKDGKDADPIDMDAVKAIIIEAMPVAPELPDIAGMVDSAVSKAVEAIPAPKDGKSITVDDVKPLIDEAVSKAVSAIPVPTNGKDGVDAVDCLIDKNGHLWFTFSNGRTKDVGQVVGDDGVDCDFDGVWKLINAKLDSWPKPKDGVDGMGFDDLSMEYDGERTFKFVMVRDDRRKEFEFTMPVVLYQGAFSEGKTYTKGDSVTFGGSVWIAQTDEATEKPGDSSKQWRLSVKHGRPGKDGVMTVPRANVPVKL